MFKDSMKRWITKGLFYEANNYKIDNALFTTGDEDITVKGKDLISFKKRFVESGDPTGYTVSKEILGGFSHWKAIENSSMRSYIEEWREELEVSLRSQGIKKVLESAKRGNYQAAKFLSDKGWDKREAGRPTRAEVERETRVMAKVTNEFEDDFLRMENQLAN